MSFLTMMSFLFFLMLPMVLMSVYLIPLMLITLAVIGFLSMSVFFIAAKIAHFYDRWCLIKKSHSSLTKKTRVLSGDFSSLQLQNSDLIRFQLRNLIFNKTNMSKINATGTHFQQASFINAILRFSNCKMTNFNKCNLSFANLSQANFSYATFQEATILKANFANSTLYRANLSHVNAERSCFEDCKLKGANLDNSIFRNTNLCGADLSLCSFKETNFKNAIFNDETILPFDFEIALNKGMFYIPSNFSSKRYNSNQKLVALEPISKPVKTTSRYGEQWPKRNGYHLGHF